MGFRTATAEGKQSIVLYKDDSFALRCAGAIEDNASYSEPAYRLQVRRTGFRANDAYTAYLEMGSPKKLTPVQIKHLSNLTKDTPRNGQSCVERICGHGRVHISDE